MMSPKKLLLCRLVSHTLGYFVSAPYQGIEIHENDSSEKVPSSFLTLTFILH